MPDNIIEIVNTCFARLSAEGPGEVIAQVFSEDFKLIAGNAEIDRKSFIQMMKLLYTAIPDLTHTLSNVQVRGDVVQLTDQPAGKFTGHWDGSSFGLPAIPPSGNLIQMAPTKWEITVRNGKITRCHDVTVPSAASGLRGFINALGSGVPKILRMAENSIHTAFW